MRRRIRNRAMTMGVLLLALVIGFLILYCWSVSYTRKERVVSFSAEETEAEREKKECRIRIYPRGASTDSWIKRVSQSSENGENGEIQYIGIIYELEMTNLSADRVSDWSARITMPMDGFINNAWCGTMELCQSLGGDEKRQTLDLRNYSAGDITLDYEIIDSDLMIPLKKGDSFTYYPSSRDHENDIPAQAYDGDTSNSKTIGFIAYFEGIEPSEKPEFLEFVLTYHLSKNVYQMPVFWILCALAFIWVIALVALIAMYLKVRELLVRQKQNEKMIEESISTFMGFIEAKDANTNGHSRRVAEYTRKLAKKLGYSEEKCHLLYYIALMHDCGKIGVPESILQKPGKLTDEEYAVIKNHTTLGGDLLKNFTSLPHIREGALYHHERYDGKGYPSGLAGEAIPITGRIICVADSFDAMNSARCYRGRLTKEKIMDELAGNRGTQFDPVIVDCMVELLKSGEIEF